MEPNKFRESRQTINKQCKDIDILIKKKNRETSQVHYDKVYILLDELRSKAKGKIQKLSVKNLGLKLKGLLISIEKLKSNKKEDKKAKKKSTILWNKERIGHLDHVFLEKLVANMGDDTDAKVCLSITGKGIRPRYEIEFGNHNIITFNGATHTPIKTLPLIGKKKMSQPISYEVINSIQLKK